MNEHTDALQWVKDCGNEVKKQLDEISLMHSSLKKDQERNLKTMFRNE